VDTTHGPMEAVQRRLRRQQQTAREKACRGTRGAQLAWPLQLPPPPLPLPPPPRLLLGGGTVAVPRALGASLCDSVQALNWSASE